MLNILLDRETAEKAAHFIGNSETWGELEARVLENNPFKIPEKELKAKSCRVYLQYFLSGCCAALGPKERRKASIFPGSMAEKDGIEYHIHGIRHIKSMKNLIECAFGKAENLVTETNLSTKYALEKAISQTRLNECRYLPLDDYFCFIAASIIPITVSSIEGICSGKKCSPEKAEDYRTIFNFEGRKIMMEDIWLPERIEHSLMESYLEDYFYRSVILRSLSQAEFIETHAKSLGANEMHGIYGMFHEPEIAYFLKNPEQSEKMKSMFGRSRFRDAGYVLASSWPAAGAFAGTYVAADCILHTGICSFDSLSVLALGIYCGASAVKTVYYSNAWRIINRKHRKRKKD